MRTLFAELSSDKIALAIRDYGYSDIRHGLKRHLPGASLDPTVPLRVAYGQIVRKKKRS